MNSDKSPFGFRHSICSLCGSPDVEFLAVVTEASLRADSAQRHIDPYCARCVARPRARGEYIIKISYTTVEPARPKD